jgi:hypothetical protein
MPERSMPAMRELKKSPHAGMRSGAGQAGAFTGGYNALVVCDLLHAAVLSIT